MNSHPKGCRHCHEPNLNPFLDLGIAPPSNSYLSQQDLDQDEITYPLIIEVCPKCWLVQTQDFASRETFFSKDYAYFSSFSTSWLNHAKEYVGLMTDRFSLDKNSMIVEIAANDGYLLQYAKEQNIPCFGVEPTTSTADAARKKGIDIVEEFFGEELGLQLKNKGHGADLTVANNVLAHVPDINDFVKGFAALLNPQGVATFEFPHLLEMLKHNQFDTVYHEHYSYLSLSAVKRIFKANGLSVFDVDTVPFHGGSLRVFAQRSDTGHHKILPSVEQLLADEIAFGLHSRTPYAEFQMRAQKVSDDLVTCLKKCQQDGLKVAAFGAAAKGNTVLNFAGIDASLISVVADSNPAKQGKFMPGSQIPIVSLDAMLSSKPDRVVILPWNIKNEIKELLSPIRDWGGMFITAVPELKIEK